MSKASKVTKTPEYAKFQAVLAKVLSGPKQAVKPSKA